MIKGNEIKMKNKIKTNSQIMPSNTSLGANIRVLSKTKNSIFNKVYL